MRITPSLRAAIQSAERAERVAAERGGEGWLHAEMAKVRLANELLRTVRADRIARLPTQAKPARVLVAPIRKKRSVS